ncbi:hypothetical protein [Azohydromonas caseinilytica]|uniref:DUF4426 domain-containing protein n=1 Tax=Azohydromonas caseinilytica TaxID=2728836 RepID=A0A848FJ78_9BURK|nr:hypothetical protein [Azohydromonas caseinilytica]NML18359.1 hypothetical protein [Azohydromonas caseinilytica]
MKTISTLFAVLMLSLGGAAVAHDDAMLDAMKTANGGQLRAAGIHHYELVVAKPGTKGDALPVVVYVTDHAGTKVPTQGATGTVTLLAGGQKSTVQLQPAGENVLKGSGVYMPQAGLKAIVSVSLNGQPAAQARFEPFAAVGGHNH